MNAHHTPPVAALELDSVSFIHRGHTLLKPTTLRLAGCQRTLIMGPNGAGKSLLMRLAHGLLTPTNGTVRWQGEPPPQAMVFQRPVLLRRSALDNLTFVLAINKTPRPELKGLSRKAQAMSALEKFGLPHLARRPARVLSGGEQQRLALARAWLLNPQVLFLDEPTSALDPAAIKAVEDAVLEFHHSGTRIVMTTHDLHQARRLANDVLFLHNGELLEHTLANDFFKAPASREAEAFIRGELVW
ncbi:ATP-binding cassette domain-containing protein [Halomonas sp. HAL1]|uniref:ATP-binding cassette domain-containing protein n=1 Tax=Halomonas sp. HAL1 TaxID=550984 RepID=UPI00022D2B40|nr:ATP-binding cassette domain-containing protein [Halomonas sp. HAL1]EHA14908.1 ABC transporter-like protein [Halomonas sp. HAL1]WKV94353.1 ATP-binding cassette domain-containing protein [Halomonas sp. HAL1]|tara:strand:- start:1172 stop:1903 length:732 start_codon:yes stop_codon:yes gene_type:complete